MHSELLCLLYLSFAIVHIISKKIKTSLTLKCIRNCGLPFGTFMFVSQSAEYLKNIEGQFGYLNIEECVEPLDLF